MAAPRAAVELQWRQREQAWVSPGHIARSATNPRPPIELFFINGALVNVLSEITSRVTHRAISGLRLVRSSDHLRQACARY